MLDTYLKENFETVYERTVNQTEIDVIPKTLVLAQDAALDQMDLWARVAANAKSQRRLLWLQPSQWSKQLKRPSYAFSDGKQTCLWVHSSQHLRRI